jgi:hypothetical protein
MQLNNIHKLGQKPRLGSGKGLIPSLIVLPNSYALNFFSTESETIVKVLKFGQQL